MRHLLPHLWPSTCLLIAVAACGCQNCRQCCCSNCAARGAAVKGTPVAAQSPSAFAARNPVKYVATYPKLPPTASTADQSALEPATDYQQSAAPRFVPTVAKKEETSSSNETLPDGPRYAHDANYHWLVGTIDYSRIQDAWVLRYVSIEEDDRYGGCVTLVAPGHGVSLKPGQTVRVEGALIDPSSQQLRPAFQVRNLRVEGS